MKLQEVSMNYGGPIKEYDTFTQELDYNDYEKAPQRYEWTVEIVKAIQKMEKLGMTTFADLLNHKQFHKDFLVDIKKLIEKLPSRRIKLPHGDKPCSQAQITYLTRFLFNPSDIKNISKGEAHHMIRGIAGPEPLDSPFRVPSGAYCGLHIAETPFAYRTHVLKHYPDSPVAEIIRLWNNHNEKKQA